MLLTRNSTLFWSLALARTEPALDGASTLALSPAHAHPRALLLLPPILNGGAFAAQTGGVLFSKSGLRPYKPSSETHDVTAQQPKSQFLRDIVARGQFHQCS